MSTDQTRRAYLDVGLATASPTKLLTMLWDRLVLDLVVAEESLASTRPADAHERLLHAQDIVFELRSTLRLDAWDGAAGLAALFAYVEQRLVEANLRKDASLVAECRSLLEPLCSAVHEAARLALVEQAGLAETA